MSAQPFLICALPRSRTAWLANLLSYDSAACGHEMMAEFPRPEQLAAALTESEMVHAGNADTSQSLHIDALMEAMPGVKVAAITRPVAEVMASLARIGVPSQIEILQPMVEAMERIAAMPDVMAVNFRDLRDEGMCEALVHHLTPNVWHDHRRCRMLQDFKVEITPARWGRLFAAARKNVLEN